MNEFSAFCPAPLKSQLKHKIMTGAIKNAEQARAFCTRAGADQQRDSTKSDEGDWKVATSKKTRARNSRRVGLKKIAPTA